MDIATLRERIEELSATSAEDFPRRDALEVFEELRNRLNRGEVRSAEPDGDGGWRTNAWVKQGILLGFRAGELADVSSGGFSFTDKENLPTRAFGLDERVRLVPGGSAIRDGAYVAPGTICMPPMYINIGAYIDAGSMVDSHALVGTCAQIGRNVHLSAAAQIGGVLEPIGANPVIVEDDVMIGGNCGIYEGTIIRRRAVLGSGVILTASVPVYDLVTETIHRGTTDRPLEIPEGAVVVMGSRPAGGEFATENRLAIATPLIVKYRDEKTDARTAMEDGLR